MANFVYSEMEGKNNPLYGKFEHPIKALIENEANLCEQCGKVEQIFRDDNGRKRL